MRSAMIDSLATIAHYILLVLGIGGVGITFVFVLTLFLPIVAPIFALLVGDDE